MLFSKNQPLDTSIQAEYEDGFILDETEHEDINPYGAGNILKSVINKDAEHMHGKLVRLSLFYKNKRHDIDWTQLPENARPIRFRNFSADVNNLEDKWVNWVRFGFQYTDEQGKNHQEVTEY